MKILDLFAGIGGFSLAGHWMGWQTAAFVEWDKHAQKVLAKNFPGVPIYSDIKTFSYEQEKEKIGTVDIVSGGFPCQPFSTAGKREGANDDRYLWPEMLRVIREAQLAWVVGENVAGLLSMDGGAVFEEVCASMEDEGYKVEPFVLPALSVGAPHRRDRVWIVAHAGHYEPSRRWAEKDHRGSIEKRQQARNITASSDSLYEPTPTHAEKAISNGASRTWRWRKGFADICKPTPTHAHLPRMEGQPEHGDGSHEPGWQHLYKAGHGEPSYWQHHWYESATRLCRVDDGLPAWVDANRTQQIKQLGNSIVPQVVYEIFKAIQQVEDEKN